MAYVPQHNYRIKDGLETGDPDKVIYGSDLQDDFEAIARDLSLLDADNVADQAGLDKEIQDRKDADNALQAQINDINNGGDDNFVDAPNDGVLYGRQSSAWAEIVIPDAGVSDWADIENKPTEFPPSAHTHEIAEVTGLQDALDNAGDTTQLEADVAANASAISVNTGNISANTTAINNKLDADKIWTGTEAQYNTLTPDADTLYFITETIIRVSADTIVPDILPPEVIVPEVIAPNVDSNDIDFDALAEAANDVLNP